MKKVILIALFASNAVSQLFAGTLVSYTAGDVLICFRKSGGANDLVVDAGPVSNFTNAAPNTRIPIAQYTPGQLSTLGYNSLIFSAFTWFTTTSETGNNQLFMTRGRSSIDTQTLPYSQIPSITPNANYNCGNNMTAVPAGASASAVRNYATTNTDTAVLEPDDSAGYGSGMANSDYTSGASYAWAIIGDGNVWGGYWGAGNPEKTTPSTFTTGSTVVRSDFYFVPAQGYGSLKFLGYFELNTNGAMTYVAYPTATPTVPVIQSITRTNTTSYVRFTTGNSGTYTLRGTNSSAGFSTPRTNWPSITSVAGNGAINMLQDTDSVNTKFYVITAQ